MYVCVINTNGNGLLFICSDLAKFVGFHRALQSMYFSSDNQVTLLIKRKYCSHDRGDLSQDLFPNEGLTQPADGQGFSLSLIDTA